MYWIKCLRLQVEDCLLMGADESISNVDLYGITEYGIPSLELLTPIVFAALDWFWNASEGREQAATDGGKR